MNKNSGFTIIELMMIVTIVGILASIFFGDIEPPKQISPTQAIDDSANEITLGD